MRKLAKDKREASELQEEVANLLEAETLPLEEAKEVFKRRQEEESSSQDSPPCGLKVACTGLTTEDYFEVKAEPVSPTPKEEN